MYSTLDPCLIEETRLIVQFLSYVKTLSDYPPRNEIDAIKIAGRTIMRTASSCFRNKVYKHSYTIAQTAANRLSFYSRIEKNHLCAMMI